MWWRTQRGFGQEFLIELCARCQTAALTDMEMYLPMQEILTKCFAEQQFNIKRHIQADGETGR